MPRPPNPRVIKTCAREECATTFEVGGDKRSLERQYCSKDCSNKATAQARGDAYRASHGYVPPVCPCGKTIVPAAEWGYAYNKKYCDDDCRRKYAPVRQRDESKWETYTCRNPNCGKTFERRKNSRNAKHYCSLACSNKMTKAKHHVVIKDDDVLLDSSWEAYFWGACKIAKIDVERFDRSRGVAWDPKRPDRWYAPDFWLPRYQVPVEIKGYEDPDDPMRWSAFNAAHARPVLVLIRESLLRMTPESLLTRIDESYLDDREFREAGRVTPVSIFMGTDLL